MLEKPAANATSAKPEVGRLDEHPRGLCATRPSEGQRPGPELGGEQPGEVPRRVADPSRQPLDALAVDDAVGDQPHRAAGRGRGDVPVGAARRRVGEAALAGAVAGGLRRRRAGVEGDVVERRRAGRAGRAAVDPGRAHRGVEDTVEATVARLHRAVAGLRVEVPGLVGHVPILTHAADSIWRESDTGISQHVRAVQSRCGRSCLTRSATIHDVSERRLEPRDRRRVLIVIIVTQLVVALVTGLVISTAYKKLDENINTGPRDGAPRQEAAAGGRRGAQHPGDGL